MVYEETLEELSMYDFVLRRIGERKSRSFHIICEMCYMFNIEFIYVERLGTVHLISGNLFPLGPQTCVILVSLAVKLKKNKKLRNENKPEKVFAVID